MTGTRKATSVEHARCAQCRNPVRGRQAMVRHARTGMVFHRDCWSDLHATVQADYVRLAQDDGVSALLGPYQRATMASWLPEAAIDEVLEAFNEQIAELGGETVVPEAVPAEPEHERPGAEPIAG